MPLPEMNRKGEIGNMIPFIICNLEISSQEKICFSFATVCKLFLLFFCPILSYLKKLISLIFKTSLVIWLDASLFFKTQDFGWLIWWFSNWMQVIYLLSPQLIYFEVYASKLNGSRLNIHMYGAPALDLALSQFRKHRL